MAGAADHVSDTTPDSTHDTTLGTTLGTTRDPDPRNGRDGGASAVGQGEVLDLVVPLRRFVASRVEHGNDIDDIVQETVARILRIRHRLEDASLAAYAFTVARNLILTRHRDAGSERRNAHRVIDLREPERPDEILEAKEDRLAVLSAIAALPSAQRELLVSHVVGEQSLGALAAARGQGPGAAAAELSRTRARLRLDYVLARRAQSLPTAQCRPVLLALSAGDGRRQRALRAGEHLLSCPTCASVSQPLLARRSGLAGVVPLVGLGTLHGGLVRLVHEHPVTSAAAVGSTTAAAVVLGSALSGGAQHDVRAAAPRPVARASAAAASPSPSPSPSPTGPVDTSLRGPDGPVLPAAGSLVRLVGQTVVADHLRVLAVDADEGFWAGESSTARVWVQLATGHESVVSIRVGQRLSFRALVVANDPRFATRLGLDHGEGESALKRQGAHLSVPATAVTID